jgi:Fibronectin type III domain
VVTQWSASPIYGDVTLLHYIATATDSQHNTFSCTTTSTTCTITGLTNGKTYTVSVVAVSAAGSLANPESKSTVPHKIAWGLSSQLVSGVAKLTWRASPANDNCTIQKSFDSVHWSALGTSANQAFQVSAAGLSISVRVVSSEGIATDPISVTTPGVAPQMIKVVTATGAPVSGGSVTWAMTSGKARSSTAYGLLSDGSYSFPAAPGGPVQITLRNGVMPDGALVAGIFPGVLSSDSTMVIKLPPEYSGAFHRVQVVTPGGLPVWNARVTVDNIATAITVGAATFTIPSQYVPAGMYCDNYDYDTGNSSDCRRTDLVTDVTGTTSFWGYYQASTSSESDNSTSITVAYDDGVMTQTPAVVRPSLDANVVALDYEPVVLPVTSTVLATAPGALTSVTITLNAGAQPRTSLVRSHLAGFLAGRQVTVVPPAGLKTCAGQVLRAVSNAQGKATFRFCAMKSGQARFTSPGLLIPGAVTVWVKGGVASAVQSLRTSLPKRGTVNVAWGEPAFSGGYLITGYQVSYAQPGKKVTTVITKALTIQIPGLISTARYSVTVAPITKVGVGAASAVSVSVA